MNLFELVAKLTMDTSEFNQGVNQSKGIFSSLGNTVGAGAVALGNLASSGVSKAIDAVIDLGQKAFETGSEYEAAMDRVAAISGAVGADFETLNAKAKEMGATTAFSATEAASAFEYMAMAGWKTNDMVDGIAGVMNLAAASGENLATTADIVTDVITAMGYSASDSAKFADVLAAASSNANTNVGMMGETFKYVAPVAGAMGYSIEDLAVATGLMANSSIKGSQAGTSLRSILTNLTKPTKQMSEAMDELGISATNSDGSMKSLREVMTNMRTSFDGLSESEQTYYAATIAGQEAMSGLLAIVNASEEDFNKLTDAVDNSAGTALDMASTMQNNVKGALEELGGAFETMYINLFEKFQEPLAGAIDLVTGFVSTVATALETGGIKEAAQAAADYVGPYLSAAFDTVKTAAQGAIDTGANVLAGIYNGLTGGEATAEDVKGYFSTLWTDVSGYAQTVVDAGSSVIGDIYTALTGDAENGEKIKETIRGVFEDPVGSISGLVDKGKTLFSDLLSGVSGDAESQEGLKTAFENVFGGVNDFFDSAATQAGTIFSEIAAALTGDSESAETIKETFATAFDDPLLTLQNMVNTGGSLISSIALALGADEESAASIGTTFTTLFTSPLSTIGSVITKGSSIITEITKAFTNPEARAKFYTSVKGAFKEAVDYISSLPGQALQWGKDLIDDFVKGLLEKWNALKAKVSGVANTIKGWFSGGGSSDSGGKSHAVGLDYVPYDNYSANLHRGEAVLTRSEAEEWRRGESGGRGGVTVVQNIYAQEQTAAELMQEAYWQQERAVLYSV